MLKIARPQRHVNFEKQDSLTLAMHCECDQFFIFPFFAWLCLIVWVGVRSDVLESFLVEAEVVAEFMKHREADFFADGVFDRTS